MKKFLSVLLTVLMVAATMVCCCVAFAQDETETEPVVYGCNCTTCLHNADCECCYYCRYTGRRMDCVKLEGAHGEAVLCCENCTGWLGCRCGEGVELCNCNECKKSTQSGSEINNNNTQIFDSDTQKAIIETFRSVLTKISEIFDKFFTAVEEFLRIDDFFGTNE